MSRLNINIGTTANDRTGDPLRTAFEKVNANFIELYATTGADAPANELVNGTMTVSLDAQGTLQVPYPTSDSFRLVLSADRFVSRVGKTSLTLTGAPWDFYGAVAYNHNGQSDLVLDAGPFPSLTNPGYVTGDEFTFDSTVHGIPGYILTITLDNVIQAGPAGWTASLLSSDPPVYPSTVKSLGAIKLTTNTYSWIFGTDGKLTLPLNGDIVNSSNVSVLTPTALDGGDASTTF
jgi:hypothetical protein